MQISRRQPVEVVIGFVRLGRNCKPFPLWENPWMRNVDAGVELSQIDELKHITVIIILSVVRK